MADPSVTTPEWVIWVSGIIGTAAAAFVAKLGLKAGAQDRTDNAKVGVMMAVQPTSDRMTTDALVQTLATLKHAVDRLADILEDQERDREADEKAELRELRRIVKDIRAKE